MCYMLEIFDHLLDFRGKQTEPQGKEFVEKGSTFKQIKSVTSSYFFVSLPAMINSADHSHRKETFVFCLIEQRQGRRQTT